MYNSVFHFPDHDKNASLSENTAVRGLTEFKLSG